MLQPGRLFQKTEKIIPVWNGTGDGGGTCGFFRWGDELEQYSLLRLRTPLTAEDVKRETREVDPADQLNAWCGVQQGTTRWHELRACRVTASNFGSAHRTNTYCSPADLLRNILWPSSMDSVAMRYGTGYILVHPKYTLARKPEREGGTFQILRVVDGARGSPGPPHIHR